MDGEARAAQSEDRRQEGKMYRWNGVLKQRPERHLDETDTTVYAPTALMDTRAAVRRTAE